MPTTRTTTAPELTQWVVICGDDEHRLGETFATRGKAATAATFRHPCPHGPHRIVRRAYGKVGR